MRDGGADVFKVSARSSFKYTPSVDSVVRHFESSFRFRGALTTERKSSDPSECVG